MTDFFSLDISFWLTILYQKERSFAFYSAYAGASEFSVTLSFRERIALGRDAQAKVILVDPEAAGSVIDTV